MIDPGACVSQTGRSYSCRLCGLSETQDSVSLREVTDSPPGNTDSDVRTLTDFHHLGVTLRVPRVVLGLAVVLPGVLFSHPSEFLERYFQRCFSAVTHRRVSKTLSGCLAEDKAKVKSCLSGWSFILCSCALSLHAWFNPAISHMMVKVLFRLSCSYGLQISCVLL